MSVRSWPWRWAVARNGRSGARGPLVVRVRGEASAAYARIVSSIDRRVAPRAGRTSRLLATNRRLCRGGAGDGLGRVDGRAAGEDGEPCEARLLVVG